MAGERQGVVAVLGARPALPFPLATPPPNAPAVAQDPRIDAILDKLDALLTTAAASRLEMQSLRQLSLEVLEAARAPRLPALAPSEPPTPAREARSPVLRLRLIGAFQVLAGDTPVTDWPGKKPRLLLAYLALERGRLVPRDVLVELFWPEFRSERGANNLSIAVHQLRSTLSRLSPGLGQAVTVRHGLYGLDQSLVHADVWDVQGHLSAARQALERGDNAAVRLRLGSAVDLCRGDLLESDPYEEWATDPRRTLGTACLQALAWLALEASGRSDWSQVIEFAGRILQREPCHEAAHRWLMLAHWRLGNRSQALLQYRTCCDWLQRDLGVSPSEETRRAYAKISGEMV